MQERFPSISRKPTERSNAGRFPQSERTAEPLALPGLMVPTRKIAARVKARTTGCGAGGEPACALGVVNGSDSHRTDFSNTVPNTTGGVCPGRIAARLAVAQDWALVHDQIAAGIQRCSSRRHDTPQASAQHDPATLTARVVIVARQMNLQCSPREPHPPSPCMPRNGPIQMPCYECTF